MTAAIIDETLGGLNYVLKREGIVPHGPSFTVHLEVQIWPADLPASSICKQSCLRLRVIFSRHIFLAWFSGGLQGASAGVNIAALHSKLAVP